MSDPAQHVTDMEYPGDSFLPFPFPAHLLDTLESMAARHCSIILSA